jgi:hypothetical protein
MEARELRNEFLKAAAGLFLLVALAWNAVTAFR